MCNQFYGNRQYFLIALIKQAVEQYKLISIHE